MGETSLEQWGSGEPYFHLSTDPPPIPTQSSVAHRARADIVSLPRDHGPHQSLGQVAGKADSVPHSPPPSLDTFNSTGQDWALRDTYFLTSKILLLLARFQSNTVSGKRPAKGPAMRSASALKWAP